MRRLFFILFIFTAFQVFESGCSHTANSAKRKPLLFHKEKKAGLASQKIKTISASNRFSSSKRRNIANGVLGISLKNSKENSTSSYNRKYSSTNSSSAYSKRFGRIIPRKFLFIKLFGGEKETTASYGVQWKNASSSSYFSSKKRMMKQRKSLLFFLINPTPSSDSYSTNYKGINSSYSYNKNFKRVTRKKFLYLFTINKREAETSTFKGGEIRKAWRFNVFSKKDKQVKHRYFFFNRKEHIKKHKKPQMDLFPRNERPF